VTIPPGVDWQTALLLPDGPFQIINRAAVAFHLHGCHRIFLQTGKPVRQHGDIPVKQMCAIPLTLQMVLGTEILYYTRNS
jgi:hypothetical protein